MEKINQIEIEFNIPKAIDYLKEKKIGLNEYLRIMFMITYFLKEDTYTDIEYESYVTYLRKYFHKYHKKFSNNPEYLFYMGNIISMGEWYFNIELKQAIAMIKKASLIEPNNNLYQWINCDLCIKDSKKQQIYAKKILEDKEAISQLSSKGLLGQYIIGMLECLSSSDYT